MTVPDSYLEPPDHPIYDCGCGHSNEDHESAEGWGSGPCQIDGCDCSECQELGDVIADHLADEADRRRAEMKEGA